MPEIEIPQVADLNEVETMLSERVKEWTEQWKAEGFQQGMEKGMRQGAQEGKAVFLIRLLEKKFGPLGLRTLARIKAAEPEQLLAWGERVLGARELGGVFGDAE
jgi:flagellar biosynthesis/type III secretory pathway protein FliH